MTEKISPETQDALVARAIDRVLDAEHTARAHVKDCEAQARDRLEHARQQRRAIMERARVRIVSLHSRVSRALEQRDAQLQEQQRTAIDASAHSKDSFPIHAALARLAQRLTSSEV